MPASSKRSKTSRFPVARIKKIMQMDEEVGKLASATPVMISKSLECFLQLLVDESTNQARSKGSKKIAAHHVKHAVNTNPSFDFLMSAVSKIPEPTVETSLAGDGEHASGSGSGAGPSRPRKPTSHAEGGAPGTGATRGRKRKTANTVPTPTDEGTPSFGRSPVARSSSYGNGNSSSNANGSGSKPSSTTDQRVKKEQQEWAAINPTPRSMINLLNPSPGSNAGGGGPHFPGMGPAMGGGVKDEPDRGTNEDQDMDSPAGAAASAPTTAANEQKGMFDDYDDEDDY